MRPSWSLAVVARLSLRILESSRVGPVLTGKRQGAQVKPFVLYSVAPKAI